MSGDNIAISVRNLTTTCRIFWRPGERLKQSMTIGLRMFHKEFTTVNDVSSLSGRATGDRT